MSGPARLVAAMRRDEGGVTLMETVIAIGILALALTMVGLPLSAALREGDEWRDDLSATTTLRQASGWVARDAFNAEVLSVGDGSPPADSLTIDWLDTGGAPHTVSYTLSGNDLVRDLDSSALIVGRRVNSVSFSRAAELLTFDMQVDAASGTTDSITSYHLLRSLP